METVNNQQLVMDFEVGRQRPLLSVSEIFDICDQDLLRHLQEDRRLERKSPGIHAKELGEYISMWANTGPEGGLIVVGLLDDGKFKGMHTEGPKRLNELEGAHEIYAPQAQIECKRIFAINEQNKPDFVLLIWVKFSKDKVVNHSSGNAYIRVADKKKKLTGEEVLELKSDRKEISFELLPSSLSWPDDFNMAVVRLFIDAVKRQHLMIEDHADEQVLVDKRLGRFDNEGNFLPNITAALLLANDPQLDVPGSKVHFLRFSGREEFTGAQRNVIKEEWFEGNVPDMIQRSAGFIGDQLREFSALAPDGKFYRDPEYPRDAWYEALVNAVVHRSYGLKNVEVTVKMFENRLVFESPGGFPPTVTPTNIYNSRYPRNPHLMTALLYFRYVKCSNEGTKRMKREMLSHNLPAPEFTEFEAAYCKVIVTLENNIENRQPWMESDHLLKVQNAIFSTLSDEERSIMAFVAENGSINISEATRAAGITWARAKVLLFKLQQRALLIHKIKKDAGQDRKVDTRARFTLPEIR